MYCKYESEARHECKFRCRDGGLSREQQRCLDEAIATVSEVFDVAQRKFRVAPEPARTQLEVTYINSVIALLVAVK